MGALATLVGSATSCGKSAPRPVTVYTLATCETPSSAGGAKVTATYTATGDFSPPPEESGPLSGVATPIPLASLPAATRSMFVEVSGAERREGASLVDPKGPVDVLVLPFQKECALPSPVSPPLMVDREVHDDPGETIGLVDAHHALVVGGSSPASASASVIDLGTGAIASASPPPLVRRVGASVTPWGAGAVVAGGEGAFAADSFEVYASPQTGSGAGGFQRTGALRLRGGARSHHGAVQLSTGGALLVGGTDGTHALRSLDYIPPGASESTLLRTRLAKARVRPAVFLLPTGKLFVGGGFDDTGAPVDSVEWLDADLSVLESSNPIVSAPLCMTSRVQAFAPLEGGAVLAVFGAPVGTVPAGCSNVQVIRRDTVTEQAPPLSPAPTGPMLLFAGAESSPLLVTGDGVRTYDPWSGEFGVPFPGGTGGTVPTTAMLSADPGLALWLAEDARIHAVRFASRNVYSTDTREQGPLLVTDTAEFAPDRLGTDGDVTFVRAALELSNGASAFLTDATFADFDLSFTATGPLELALRDDATGGPAPLLPGTWLLVGTKPTHVAVQRRGALVSVGVAGQTPKPCMTQLDANERLAIGFQGPASGGGTATVGSVTVDRVGAP